MSVDEASPRGPTWEPVPVVTLLTEVLRQRPRWLRTTVLGMLLAAGWVWLRGPSYTAEARFAPQGARRNNIAGLFAQFGIDVSGFGNPESAVFYLKLFQSGDVLWDLAQHRYRFPVAPGGADSLEGNLIDLYKVRASTPDRVRQKIVRRLERDVYAGADMRAEVVTLRVTAPWPALAEQLAREALLLVNEFNLVKRQSQARAEREFLEQRLARASQDLRDAEDQYRRFLEKNTLYQQSPSLVFEAARLQREVEFRQEVLTSLAQAHEEAKINEVRDTPLINVIQQPEASARQSAGAVFSGILGAILGALVGVGMVFGRVFLARQRERFLGPYAEFDDVRRRAWTALVPARWRHLVVVRTGDGGRSGRGGPPLPGAR